MSGIKLNVELAWSITVVCTSHCSCVGPDTIHRIICMLGRYVLIIRLSLQTYSKRYFVATLLLSDQVSQLLAIAITELDFCIFNVCQKSVRKDVNDAAN